MDGADGPSNASMSAGVVFQYDDGRIVRIWKELGWPRGGLVRGRREELEVNEKDEVGDPS